MKYVSLEEVIRQYVYLPPTPNAKGWYPCVHQNCDHGRKGPRAAFNFSTDGSVAFHCFNCPGGGTAAVFDPNSHRTMPKKMKKVLTDFNIPEDEWQQVLFHHLGDNQKSSESKKHQPKKYEPTELPIPEPFYLLSENEQTDKWAIIAEDYLKNERNIDPSSYPFMLCGRSSDKRWDKWKRRVIIPIFKQNKLVFFQGRGLTDDVQPKYMSPNVPKEKILYGYDRIFEQSQEPLYVVEGWFDAFKINGVALLGNELTDEQIYWLSRSPRQKVYIPDRYGNGRQAAEHALNIGWAVSTPDVGTCKDMSDAVDKYGLLYVLKTITENTLTDKITAQTRLGFYCER